MLRVGLVDDRFIDLDKLNGIVASIPEVEVVFSTMSAEEAYEHIKKEPVELVIAEI